VHKTLSENIHILLAASTARLLAFVHGFSDVLGGWLFGAFWLTFALSVFVWLESADKFCSEKFEVVANWLYVVAVVVSVLVVASGFIA
jgi:hypothetical protein